MYIKRIILVVVLCALLCSCSNINENSTTSSASNSLLDKKENTILGMALVIDSNLSIYESPDAQSTMLIEIPYEIGVPFYSVKNDWVLVEYENARGWASKNNLELVYSDDELMSKIKAQDLVLKDINNKNNLQIIFTTAHLQQELGGKITWYIEFELDNITGWDLIDSITGQTFASDRVYSQ